MEWPISPSMSALQWDAGRVSAGQAGLSQEEKGWYLLLPGINLLCRYLLKPLMPPKPADSLFFIPSGCCIFPHWYLFLFWIFELLMIQLLSGIFHFLSCIAFCCSFSYSAVSAVIWVKDVQLHPITAGPWIHETAEPLREVWRRRRRKVAGGRWLHDLSQKLRLTCSWKKLTCREGLFKPL